MKVADEVIISALLSCDTNQQAAEKCGITVDQLYRRIRAPDFKEKLEAAKADILGRATCALQASVGDAVDTMVQIMQDDENAPQVRLNAAESVIRNCIRMTEQNDILKRIAELEGRQDG